MPALSSPGLLALNRGSRGWSKMPAALSTLSRSSKGWNAARCMNGSFGEPQRSILTFREWQVWADRDDVADRGGYRSSHRVAVSV